MFTSTLVAAAIVLGVAQNPTYHSVQWFDNAIQVSQRVLDGSIKADIDRVHPIEDSVEWPTMTPEQQEARRSARIHNRKKNHEAVQEHCKNRLRAEGMPEGACGEGFRR